MKPKSFNYMDYFENKLSPQLVEFQYAVERHLQKLDTQVKPLFGLHRNEPTHIWPKV